MDAYDLSGACAAIAAFLDRLTNWYIRRSRDRFWGTSGGAGRESDTQDAFDTLATVLEVLCRLAAPLLPLTVESVWTGLTGQSSVHMASWPSADGLPSDPALVARMDLAREVCSAAHSVRKANGLRARLPLATLVVAGPSAGALEEFADLIADEVNVKSVVFEPDPARYASSNLSVVFKVAAPRLGPETQAAAAAARAGDWNVLSGADEGRARVGSSILEPGEFEMRVTPADDRTTRPLPGRAGVVVLDVDVSPDLEMEGRARDLVRLLQQARREMGLEVTDRIAVEVGAGPVVADLMATHGEMIAEQVLAVDVRMVEDSGATGGDWVAAELADGTPVRYRLQAHPELGSS
jgi:isoleucyl-tRNA synthetase